jgi:hypothetical protein
MKMLCVKCDQGMSLKDSESGGDGTAGLVFVCQKCGASFAMLINPMEAQLVKSLGVQVGGRKEPAKPMEMIKDSLLAGDSSVAGTIAWDKEAEERLKNVPAFVRPMVRGGIEKFASGKGITRITTSVMDEAKKLSGM